MCTRVCVRVSTCPSILGLCIIESARECQVAKRLGSLPSSLAVNITNRKWTFRGNTNSCN